MYCKNCGAKREISSETVEINNHYKNTSLDDSNLVDLYIEKNQDKIKEGKFSFPTFFLGSYYLMYRRLWLIGFLWIIADIAISIFITKYSAIATLVFRIIFALNFNQLYLETVKKRIEKIRENHQDKTSEEVIQTSIIMLQKIMGNFT